MNFPTIGWRHLRGVRSWLPSLPKARPHNQERPVVGLALGGGFARGLAHIGVLKVLEANGIPIHAVAGVSVGAVIGGAYASGMTVREMEETARSVRFRDFASWTVSRLAFASNARMDQFLRRFVKATSFEDLRMPLAVMATDLVNGDAVTYKSGDLITPIRASCAYPGLFLPVQMGERTLIDGGFSCAVPTAALAAMGCTHVIAVHLICNPFPSAIPTNIVQMVAQCFNLLQKRAGSDWRRHAKCILEPTVINHSWDSFDKYAELIEAGEQAARAAMPGIQRWFQPRLSPELAFSR